MDLQHYIMHHLPYSLPKKRGFYELIEDEEQERFSFPALAIDFSEETARSRNTFGREKLCAWEILSRQVFFFLPLICFR